MRGKLEISKIKPEGIVIEKDEEFEKSPFRYVYQKAEVVLEKIVCSRYSENIRGMIPIYNVVSFEGRRGTGKTSAMLSVKAAMENKDSELLNRLKKANSCDDVYFNVLNYIDASRLEKKEDILELILANMFMNVREKRESSADNHGDYECRKIYQYFDSIYGSVLDSKRKIREQIGYSPIQALTQLSNSQIMGRQIRELVSEYLQYMSDDFCKNSKENAYMVIVIDDIDMHYQGQAESSITPYDMLETLHRYFFIPNVIVLLSYNYKELELACQKHFAQIAKNQYWKDKEEEQVYVQKLVSEYLNKVIPMYARVTLPSVRKKDYGQNLKKNIMVHVEREDVDKIADGFSEILFENEKEMEADVSAKTFILKLKAYIAGLYYDAAGIKRHYAEPSSLRKLAQIYIFYSQLSEIKKEGDIADVYKLILDDLYFRFANEFLAYHEMEQFEKYLDISLEYRGKYILKDINRHYVHKELQENYRGRETEKCSYGKLLYSLYRVSQDEYWRKEIIWCILDSYTILLTQIYETLENKVNSEEIFPKKVLREVLGNSIAGEWVNEIMPQVSKISSVQIERRNGYDYTIPYENADKGKVAHISFQSSIVWWEFELLDENIRDNMTEKNKGEVQNLQKKQLQTLEILCMFFTKVYHNYSFKEQDRGFSVIYKDKLKIEAPMNDRERKSARFQIEFISGCFDITNFVINLLFEDEFFEEFRKSFGKPYQEYLESIGYLEEEAARFIEQNSIKKEYDKWKEENGNWAMPVYSFDMMYNIFKRINQNKERYGEVATSDKYWENIERFYDHIGEILEKEDEFYFPESKQKGFCYKYKKSPFISFIDELKKEENSEDKVTFEKHFEDMLQSIAGF